MRPASFQNSFFYIQFLWANITIYVLLVCCVPRDNPYDPENPDFIIPQFSCTVCLLDDETREPIEHAKIVYRYKNKADSITIDSGNTASILIQDNIAENKITLRIMRIESSTHVQPDPFDITLSRDGWETTAFMHDRRGQAVMWDTVRTHADSEGVFLAWRASNAEQFIYYRVVRTRHSFTKITDTLVELVNKTDTFFFDRFVDENELYTYRIYVISSDGSIRGNSELPLTMPNRPPGVPEIIKIESDFFICLRLYWRKNTDRDFGRYVVYRSADSVAFDSVYTTDQQDDTVWLDATIDEAAHRYYYYIASVDGGGLLSKGKIVSEMNRTTINKNLVYIHEGPFTMGRSGGPDVPLNQQPGHTVMLSSFLIDRHEVTVDRYARFLDSTDGGNYFDSMATIGIIRTGSRFTCDPARANHPMTWLSWSDADAFCKWAGGKLPTEAQWEKAARGADKRLYPWGSFFYHQQNPPDFFLANYIAVYITADDSGYSNDGARYTAPVGNYATGVSPYGLFEMAGNASEWCNDWYANAFLPDTIDPQGPQLGLWRSYRGGSFKSYPEELMAVYRFRFDPSSRKDDLGCRCVYDAQ